MTFKRALPLSLLALATVGCQAPSSFLHPVADIEQRVTDDRVLGDWNADGVTFRVESGSNSSYTIQVFGLEDAEEVPPINAALTRIEEGLWLDAWWEDPIGGVHLPLHFLLLAEVEQDRLRLELVDLNSAEAESLGLELLDFSGVPVITSGNELCREALARIQWDSCCRDDAEPMVLERRDPSELGATGSEEP